MTADVKTRIKQISDDITKAKSDLAEGEASIAAMRQEQDGLSCRPRCDVGARDFSPLSDDDIRWTELGERIASAVANADHLRRHVLPTLEKRLAFFLKGSTAEDDVKRARKAYAKAMDDASVLGARRDQVLARAAAVAAELDAAVECASEVEQGAAAAYAQAVAAGDETAQLVAQERLMAELDTSAEARAAAPRLRSMVDALQAAAARLDSQRAEAIARADAARVDLARAIEAKYAVQWEMVLDQLLQAGVRISAARRLGGLQQSIPFGVETGTMKIPRMDPGRNFVGERDIHRLAEDLVLDEAI